MLILKEGVNIENLTIRNDSGSGDQVGQAVALFVNADRVNVTNCKITACQDTLLTGPIPKDAKNQENLIFKIEHEAIYRQCYVDCLIQGDVDFIFGSGNAIFINCTIVSNNLNKEINGYISAPSTEKGQLGHIFFQCKLLSDAEKGTVYLGRPWRDFANTVYINCFMGQHINKTGFAKWNDTERHLNSRFYEYGSYGPGALREKSLSKQLNDDEIELYKNCIRNL
jgi:pectinesterase